MTLAAKPQTRASAIGFCRAPESRAAKALPRTVETFRRCRLSFRSICQNSSTAAERRECKPQANHSIYGGSTPRVAIWFLLDGTEGLLQVIRAAFSLTSTPKGPGGGKSGSNQVEPEALHGGRGIPPHRDLPRPPAHPGSQQAPRKTGAGSGSRWRGSREVAVYEHGLDDTHGSAPALPALVSPPAKFPPSVFATAQICISNPGE